MTKNMWTDSEIDQLARALAQRYPSRRFESATRPHQIDLNDLELTPVLQSTLEAERWGLRPKISRVKRDLLEAFKRITGKAAATVDDSPAGLEQAEEGSDTPARQRKVRWTSDEWRFCALALHTLCPQLDLVNAPNAEGVTLKELNMAAGMMEPGRQRVFKSLAEPMAHLMQIYERARRENDPFYFSNKPPAPRAKVAAPVEPTITASRAGEPKIFWTADEYKLLAKHLLPQYPNALEGDLPGLTSTELGRAVQAVLPPERQRRMANQAHVTSFIRRLRDTLAGKPIWTAEQFVERGIVPEGEPEKADWRSGPRILWSADEWDALVRKLHELEPELEDNPEKLTLVRLNEASSLMARPRKFFTVASPRKLLDEARERLTFQQYQEKQNAAVVAPTVAAAPAEQPEPASTAPSADKLFSRVDWGRDEWLAIARELHRLFPLANYPKRGNLIGLDSHDVAFAQERALPFERRRRHIKVASFPTLKAPLERAFADLAIELDKAAAPRMTAAPTPAPTPAPQPTPAPAAPPPVPAAVTAAAPADALIDPYRAAFAPIVGLVATEVANQLFPMLTQFINQAVTIALQAQTSTSIATETPQEAAAAPAAQAGPVALTCVSSTSPKKYGDEKPRTEKPKRMVVGVLVNRASQYRAELEREFPQLEIKIGDVSLSNAAANLAHVDKAICMTRFVDHPQQRNLKKLTGDRYVDCNGGMSELKRIINIWLKSIGAEEGAGTERKQA